MRESLPPDCGTCPIASSTDAIARRRFLELTGLLVAPLVLTALGAHRLDARPVRAEEKRYPIPDADGVSVDKDAGVLLARTAGRVYAFSLACPHQNTALRWEPEEKEFKCPKHKSHYRADGSFIAGRATRPMDRLALRREGSVIVVNVDKLYQQDENPAEWASAFVAL